MHGYSTFQLDFGFLFTWFTMGATVACRGAFALARREACVGVAMALPRLAVPYRGTCRGLA